MIDISYEEAVGRIHQESGLSVPEIQSRVDAKLKQLSGLISRDGAVHILANELGIQLARAVPIAGAHVKIKDISLQSRGIVVVGRVVQKYDVRTFSKNGRDGRVASLLLGDETGVTRVVFWNDQVDVFEQLTTADVLEVRNPFVKPGLRQDRLELQLNTQSSLVVNPEGITIQGREMTTRPPAVQKYISDITGNEENIELIATIMQVYDPRFFDSCPQCNKKLLGANQCPEHGEVIPSINCSMSAILDDGSGNIRCTFWKSQALRLTKKSEAEFVQYRNDPASFEDIKTDLLGEFVKITGRVRKNDTFDRLELTASTLTFDIDPKVEMENLEKKFAKAAERNSEQKLEQKDSARGSEKTISVSENITVVEDDVVNLDDL